MEEFLKNNPSLKRLGVTVAGSAAIALNKKLNLGLEANDIMALAGIVVTYIAGSNWKAVADAKGKAAADAVTNSADAAKVLGGEVAK